jgi:arylsulfatase A-like enzyme
MSGIFACFLLVISGCPTLLAKGVAEHVVLVVWDGMRPDFITQQYTPNLYWLATNGVFFKNHHPVYISSTEVNGTAIATGNYPSHNGIIGNLDYRPEIGWLSPNATEGIENIRRGDMLSDGHYLLAPTVAEILQKAGISTIIAGTKPVALLHDRSNRRPQGTASNSVVLYKGQTIPRGLQAGLNKLNDDKIFPTNTTHPNLASDAWTTKSLTKGLWSKGVPKYTLLWLSEPDASQHETGPGSDISLQALESSDRNLGEVFKALTEKKIGEKTDIIVVSDHGFSTIVKGPDIVDILKKQRFKAFRKFDDPEPGDVLVVGLGGASAFYVAEHEEQTVQRLVEFLQGSDFAGVIFTRREMPGTFPLSAVRLDTTNAMPDIILSMRWNSDLSSAGTPGMVYSDNGTKGKGTHGSLSRYDMHNTLVCYGPDFKVGYASEFPSGNADVAPTILHILGVKPPSKMDGRVLLEALESERGPSGKPETKTVEAKSESGLFRWRQYLKFTTFDGAIYFDEGNGESAMR